MPLTDAFMQPNDAENHLARTRIVWRLSWAVGLMCSATPLLAAEIELRSEFRTEGGLVLLGDIAQVTSADAGEAKRLAALDIMAAPLAGQRRYLRARELQDLLAARGVNWAEHRLSGSRQITIIGALDKPTLAKKQIPPRVAAAAISARQATDQARKALIGYLEECSDRSNEWQIQFELTSDQAQFVGSAGDQLVVSGGLAPWTGQQRFQLTATLDGQTRQTTVRAEVTLLPMLVVASRSLPRGAVIRADDVRLQPGVASKGQHIAYFALEDVIGKEVQQAVIEGQILDDHSARPPVLVKRGEIVTVYARCGGVQIRTTARAKDEGSHNDLVTVESIADRQAYFTRVIGVQEVEVYAHAVSVPGEAAPLAATSPVAGNRAPPEAPAPANSRAGVAIDDPRTTAPRTPPAPAAAPPAKTAKPGSAAAPGSLLARIPYTTPSAPVKPVKAAREKKKKSAEPAPSEDD